MNVCICAGRKILMDSTLHCEGAVLDLPDDLAELMLADGSVGGVIVEAGDRFDSTDYSGAKLIARGAAKAAPKAAKKKAEAKADKA